MIRLYKAFINDFSSDELNSVTQMLGDEAKRHVSAINNAERRKQSLAGLLLLKRGLSELFGLESCELFYNKNGKPILDFCNFSIAHTDTLAVCAFSDKPIGVDAEKIRCVEYKKSFPFFTNNELNLVNSSNEKDCFLKLWTRKEAYVKAIGGTMSQNGGVDVSVDIQGYRFETSEYLGHLITVCEVEV